MKNTLSPHVQRLGKALTLQAQTLSTAESCTGGGIAHAITGVPGSSGWFEGGFVTYSNEAKIRLLGVGAELIATHGAVSEAVVMAMAKGALKRTGSDYAVAVSGIAGPGGGTAAKPVGTVWLAYGHAGGQVVAVSHHFRGDRSAIRAMTVLQAIRGLLDLVESGR